MALEREVKMVLVPLIYLTTSPWVVISKSNQAPTWPAPSTEIKLPGHHHHSQCPPSSVINHGDYRHLSAACRWRSLYITIITIPSVIIMISDTYQRQMKRSRGCSLIHSPVIFSGFQAESVKKKEAWEKVIDNMLCVQLRQKEHSCVRW